VEWIQAAASQAASDLYLDFDQRSLAVARRQAGRYQPVLTSSDPQYHRLSSALKHAVGIDPGNQLRQADRMTPLPDRQGYVRISYLKTHDGETWCLRIHETESLGTPATTPPPALRQAVFAKEPALHLIAGATGSGKSTTMYALLEQLPTGFGKVVTVEDPPERLLPGLLQTRVDGAANWTPATAIRAFMRQDPDLIVVGEIRDRMTARAAVRAALSGHPVLATIHAGGPGQCRDRLNSLDVPSWQIEATSGMEVYQELKARTCPFCEGTNCINCRNTGFLGREAAYEL